MTDQVDHVNTCLTFRHVYLNAMLIRCTHREELIGSVTAWIDTDDDGTEVIFEERHSFGPFDSETYVSDTMATLAARGAAAVLHYHLG